MEPLEETRPRRESLVARPISSPFVPPPSIPGRSRVRSLGWGGGRRARLAGGRRSEGERKRRQGGLPGPPGPPAPPSARRAPRRARPPLPFSSRARRECTGVRERFATSIPCVSEGGSSETLGPSEQLRGVRSELGLVSRPQFHSQPKQRNLVQHFLNSNSELQFVHPNTA